jgi:hypothetical protein
MQGDKGIAYLFQCDGEELFAVSPDKAGANIPRSSCTQGWLLRQEFTLDTLDPPIGLDSVIRSINDKGYYIWRDPCWTQRMTTHWLSATDLSARASTAGSKDATPPSNNTNGFRNF